MYCLSCGSEVKDGAVYCPACGAKVDNTVKKQRKAKKKKKIALAIIIALVCLLLVGALLLTAVGAIAAIIIVNATKTEPPAFALELIDEGDYLVAYYGNGKKAEFYDANEGFVTPDGKRVVFTRYGASELCCYNLTFSTQETIHQTSNDTLYIINVTDDGVIFTDGYNVMAYSFKEKHTHTLCHYAPDEEDACFITSNGAVAYTEGGNIFIYSLEESALIRTMASFSYDETVKLLDVTNDGSAVVWQRNGLTSLSSEYLDVSIGGNIFFGKIGDSEISFEQKEYYYVSPSEGNEDVVIGGDYVFDGNGDYILGENGNFIISGNSGILETLPTINDARVYSTKDDDVFVVTTDNNGVFVVENGVATRINSIEETNKAHILYSSRGIPAEYDAKFKVDDGFYVVSEFGTNEEYVEDSEEIDQGTPFYAIYFVTPDNYDAMILAPMATSYAFYGDKELLVVDNDELFLIEARADGYYNSDSLFYEVNEVFGSPYGKGNIYFTRYNDSRTGLNLYACDPDDLHGLTEVSFNVSEHVYLSYDGKNVYYYMNPELGSESSDFAEGRLYVYDGTESTLICEDAVPGAITSGIVGDYLDPDRIWLPTYYLAPFYNGKELSEARY